MGKDEKHNPIQARMADKSLHRAASSSDLSEAALNGICGSAWFILTIIGGNMRYLLLVIFGEMTQ